MRVDTLRLEEGGVEVCWCMGRAYALLQEFDVQRGAYHERATANKPNRLSYQSKISSPSLKYERHRGTYKDYAADTRMSSSAGFETTFEEFKKEANLVRVTVARTPDSLLILSLCAAVTARFPA